MSDPEHRLSEHRLSEHRLSEHRLSEHRLSEHLRSVAAGLPVPAGDLDTVVARGRRRRNRRRCVNVLGAVIVVVVATVGTQQLTRGPTTRELRIGSASPASADLHWHVVPTSSGLGYVTSLTAAGAVYALSSAPATATPGMAVSPATLYRSTDGITWQVAPGPAGLSLAGVTSSGGDLYAVGTGPATAALAGPSVSVARMAAGARWRATSLPVDRRAIDAVSAGSPSYQMAQVAAGPRGVLAVLTVTASVDPQKVLPAGTATPYGWVVTGSGLDVLSAPCPNFSPNLGTGVPTPGPTPLGMTYQGSPVRCYSAAGNPVFGSGSSQLQVARTYTWAQLGVSGDALRAVLGEPEAFLSTDGTHYQAVDLPSAAGSSSPIQVVAGPAGFAISEGNAVLVTQDGRHWSAAPALPGGAYVQALGMLPAGPVVVETGPSMGSAVALLAGGQWSTTSLGSLLPGGGTPSESLLQAAVGPLGVAIVAVQVRPPPGQVAPPAVASPTTVAPNAVLRSAPTAPLPTTPPTVAGSSPSPTFSYKVLFSPDGKTWSARDLSSIVPGAAYEPVNLIVSTSSVEITVPTAASAPGRPSPEVVAVGAP
ncbi:MAG: hypothetical protein ACRDY0_11190 [Acidimicrobiales bacterium]